MVPLDKTIKRAIKIKGVDYVITLTPETIKISLKGHRLGVELAWSDLVSGESALAVALHASVGQFSTDAPGGVTAQRAEARQSKSPRRSKSTPAGRGSSGPKRARKI
jgi:hypothetical protein